MEDGLLLNMVLMQCMTIFQPFAIEDELLLVWLNAFLVLDLGLQVFNGVTWFHLQSDGITSRGLNKYLYIITQTMKETES